MRMVGEYINYWLKGRNRHGVHSPFIYRFNDYCLRIDVPKRVKEEFKNYVRSLKENGKERQSFSLKSNSNKPIEGDDLTGDARIPFKYLKLIYRIAYCYHPKRVVCFRDTFGLFASMFKQANSQTEIDLFTGGTLDQPNLARVFPQEWQERVTIHHRWSEDSFASLEQDALFDMVFIDGRQSVEGIDTILDKVSSFIHDETIFLIYGIREDLLVRKKWKEWSKSKAFHVTIDLFQMGVMVRRKHQAKEHFTIRYR